MIADDYGAEFPIPAGTTRRLRTLGILKMSQTKCSARTKSGTECRATALADSNLCAFHADPNRAAEFGRMGGLKNRHYIDTEVTILPTTSPEDVKNVLAQAMVDVRARKLDPRIASTLTYMSSALLKAFESTDTERRLAELEEALGKKADKS